MPKHSEMTPAGLGAREIPPTDLMVGERIRASHGRMAHRRARTIQGKEALVEEFVERPKEYIVATIAKRSRTVRSWKRWVRDEVPLKGHKIVGIVMWLVATALDEREKGKDELAWARIYSLFVSMDQLVGLQTLDLSWCFSLD